MRIPTAALAAACLLAVAAAAGVARAEEPIIQLEQRSGMVATADATTTISVWADGSLLVHRPSYLKRSGDFRGRLSERELADLLAALGAQQVGEISTDRVVAAKSRAVSARRQRAGAGQIQRIVTDPDSTTLTLRLQQGPTRTSAAQVVTYTGVRNDAAAFPEVAELARLNAAVTEVSALADRADLEKLP